MDDLKDISVDAEINSDKFPKIKVDLRTPLELTFFWLAGLSVVAIVFAFIFSPGEKFDQQWQAVMAVAGICLVFSIAFYFNTDNYYIFDLVNKMMFYHFRFFSYTRVERVASFADIHAVTSTGSQESDRYENYHTYRVQCILNTGQILYLSDDTYENLEKQNGIARKIAAITGAEYVAGIPGCYAVAKKAGDRFSFSFFEPSWFDITKKSAFEIGAILVYVATLVTIGKNGPAIIRFLKSLIE